MYGHMYGLGGLFEPKMMGKMTANRLEKVSKKIQKNPIYKEWEQGDKLRNL